MTIEMINLDALYLSICLGISGYLVFSEQQETARAKTKNFLLKIENKNLKKNNEQLRYIIGNCASNLRADSFNTQILFIAAFRYALGRRDNFVPAIVDSIRWNRDLLTDQTAMLMANEIGKSNFLGAQCDAEAWLGLAEFLLGEIKDEND